MPIDPAHNTPPRWKPRLIRAGEFRLDAGSMFGLIPRVVWSRSVPADDRGRLTVQHNCLLLDRAGTAPPGSPKRVLIEVGSGNKLDDKMKDVFALGDRWIGSALAELDPPVACESIDAVVVTHLHFDHAGALTRLPAPGETPAWSGGPLGGHWDGGGGSARVGGCLPTFPNARVFVQRREWSDAVANRSVMTRTYYRDHLLPIEKQLVLVDSPPPFAPGLTPDRDERPHAPVDLRATELWKDAGIFVFNVPGHTWGQQAVLFTDPGGREIVFTPDVMPTVHHLGAAYSLAYDVEPYTSMVSKRWFLTEAMERRWTLCLDHEPGNPLVTVKRAARGDWFELEPAAL
ncbi:MAG TPA: MBL fold metallo-hydrolase [Phycisphaerales bacterium]|nr:MBL fold metallo-hydrolase [Phycisphaerales bacterium]